MPRSWASCASSSGTPSVVGNEACSAAPAHGPHTKLVVSAAAPSVSTTEKIKQRFGVPPLGRMGLVGQGLRLAVRRARASFEGVRRLLGFLSGSPGASVPHFLWGRPCRIWGLRAPCLGGGQLVGVSRNSGAAAQICRRRQNLSGSGPSWPKLGQLRSNSAQLRPNIDHALDHFGQFCRV